jgi:CspA family cold shock protein
MLTTGAGIATVGLHSKKAGGRISGRKHMPEGTVKWFNTDNGFGFIAPDEGTGEVFVHLSATQADGHCSLEASQRVESTADQGATGSPPKSRSESSDQPCAAATSGLFSWP